MEFTKIKAMVDRALADGKLSRDEREQIMNAVYADKKVTTEECELLRTLQEKVWKGEIQIED
ncbi:MAG TPA: hypothetical protein DDZ80_31865 [Cyanobacteria bacterium UBA8803]|nr:hypothetical protein [Cyanobacteria bacterium UBA9273]HBL62806.1 hypothetical protein [Cyanobacteria bacterium UBA8803]